jgi:hypothetical protein
MINKINKVKFEKELMPLFDKVFFSSNEPFIIPAFQDEKEYNSFFYFIYHASIYKTISFIHNKKINFEEYLDIFKRYIYDETARGSTIIYYQKKPILKIEPYKNKDNVTTEAIFPLYKKLIDFDKDILSKIEKDKVSEKADSNNLTSDFDAKLGDVDLDFNDF